MNPYLSVVPKTPGKYRVGDTVRVPHAWGGALGLIVEDRGFGYKGKRYYDRENARDRRTRTRAF
jgi:hypothetical protein